MKKKLGNKLAVATFLVSILYVFVLLFSRVDSIQKQNNGELGGEANAAYECPSGYVEVADFCIQSGLTGDETWSNAAKICAEDKDARLCRAQELMAACQAEKEDGVSFDDDIDGNDWEWTDDIADSGQAVIMFQNDNGCEDVSRASITSSSQEFRCCLNMY